MDDRKKRRFDGTRTLNNIQVSEKTVWRCLRKFGYKRCVSKKKIRIRVENSQETSDLWKNGIGLFRQTGKTFFFSDESQTVIGNNRKVYIWRKGDETGLPDCISPCIQRKISAMLWGCFSFNGVGTLSKVNGTIHSDKYIEILDNNYILWTIMLQFIDLE